MYIFRRSCCRRAAPLLIALLVSLPGTSWAGWDRDLQCVPFARSLSSIDLFGDAWRWWSEAAGRYSRGATPQAGSILSFRSNPQMPLGHIAVVTKVIGEREIEVDHANWAPGAVGRQVRVLDVSADNDWTAVRVELSEHNHFGAVYGTNGFIYGWPIQLGPQIVSVADALQALRDDGLQRTSQKLPVVLGPQGVITDKLHDRAMPVVVDGQRQAPRLSQ